MTNEWKFTGEVVRIKEFNNYDVGASLTVRGVSQRRENVSSGIVEFSVVVQGDLWEKLSDEGLKPYSMVDFTGHIETWVNISDESFHVRQKIKFWADDAKILKH